MENILSFNFVCDEELNKNHLIYYDLPFEYDNIFEIDTNLLEALSPLTLFSESIGNKCKYIF